MALAICLVVAWLSLLVDLSHADKTPYGMPREICRLEQQKIIESSGLAVSNRHPGFFWTHNDSGDEPRLFAFDMQGKHRGTSYLRGAEARDWEDMGSFVHKGHACLFVADVGNNTRPERHNLVIYVTLEPESPKKDCAILQRIEFVYEDGKFHNCEAVAVDVSRREFLLFEKHRIQLRLEAQTTPSDVWLVKWDTTKHQQQTVARKIGSIKVPPPIRVPFMGDKLRIGINNAVTGADISPDGRRAIVVTYFGGLEICRAPDEDWAQAIRNPTHSVMLPPRLQGESVCYGTDGLTLFLTSEKTPCPLFTVPVANQEK
jgi:hypothetical protein